MSASSKQLPTTSNKIEIARQLAKLLSAFPTQDTGQAANLRIDAYFEAIDGSPTWAVEHAVRRILSGSITELDGRFAPTPPQLATVVRNLVSPVNPFEDPRRARPMAAEQDQPKSQSIIGGFANLKAEMSAKKPSKWYDNPLEALAKRAAANGIDLDAALDAIPDALPRSMGTFRKLSQT
jgi:hypothetical protein